MNTVRIPTKTVLPESDPFSYTAFRGSNVMGSKSGLAHGHQEQPLPSGFDYGPKAWAGYVRMHLKYAEEIHAKEGDDNKVCIIHGDCNRWHSSEDMRTVTAVVIDCDLSPLPESAIDSFCAGLGDIRYFFQWRGGKFHLVFPIADPMVVSEALSVTTISNRRAKCIEVMRRVLGKIHPCADAAGLITIDDKPAMAAGILYSYCRRTNKDPVPITRHSDSNLFLDLDQLLGENNHIDLKPRPKRKTTVDETFTGSVVNAFAKAGRVLKEPSDPKAEDAKWGVQCPFHEDGTPSTAIVWASGHIFCHMGKCRGRAQGEWHKALGIEVKAGSYVAAVLAQDPPERHSLAEGERILTTSLIQRAQPGRKLSTVFRVTTGAGKTRAAARFANVYSAPVVNDDGSGIERGAECFFALPTNALMHEVVSKHIRVEHRVVKGVLAVLNEDGSPACKKHAAATRLQASGGDVHQKMCAGCEFKDDCVARSGASTGSGALTITNHAMLPGLVRTAINNGAVPLIIWDESPPYVESRRVLNKDLKWMLERFDKEERKWGWAQMGEHIHFGPGYRIGMRPLFEVLSLMTRGRDLQAAAIEYGGLRKFDSQVVEAERFLGLDPIENGGASDAAWRRVRRVALKAKYVNESKRTFDSLTADAQDEVLGIERVLHAIRPILESDGRSKLEFDFQAWGFDVTFLTPSAELWRDHGGVILDATAPVFAWKQIRPDTEVVDIHIRDAPGTEGRDTTVRTMVESLSLSRKVLGSAARRDRELTRVVNDLAPNIHRLAKRLDRKPKVLIISYKNVLEPLSNTCRSFGIDAEYHYFGNTRGYDRWFQEGFDAFVTVGDHFIDVASVQRQLSVLGIDTGPDRDDYSYAAYLARGESAQAHGRGRSPQNRKTGEGPREHFHYGKLPPFGWMSDNMIQKCLT